MQAIEVAGGPRMSWSCLVFDMRSGPFRGRARGAGAAAPASERVWAGEPEAQALDRHRTAKRVGPGKGLCAGTAGGLGGWGAAGPRPESPSGVSERAARQPDRPSPAHHRAPGRIGSHTGLAVGVQTSYTPCGDAPGRQSKRLRCRLSAPPTLSTRSRGLRKRAPWTRPYPLRATPPAHRG